VLIRTVSRWCLGDISGLKGFGKNLPTKAGRVGRSTQTYLDADPGPRCTQHVGAGKQRLYGLDARGLRPVHEWVGGFERFWNETFDRLDEYVRDLKQARQEEPPDDDDQ